MNTFAYIWRTSNNTLQKFSIKNIFQNKKCYIYFFNLLSHDQPHLVLKLSWLFSSMINSTQNRNIIRTLVLFKICAPSLLYLKFANFLNYKKIYASLKLVHNYNLQSGSPVDPMDKKKTTPLHLAAQFGHSKTASLLIERSASVTLTNSQGHNVLTIAIKHGNRYIGDPITWLLTQWQLILNQNFCYWDGKQMKVYHVMGQLFSLVVSNMKNYLVHTKK